LDNSAEYYLNTACEKLPVVKRAVHECGDISLWEYLKKFVCNASSAYQPMDDFLDVIYRYASRLLGKSTARQAVRDLEACPAALTSNHLGIEYFSQSLQSIILFSLNRFTHGASSATVPVFSFGNVPLNNLTYPRGALLYHISGELDDMPLNIPVFPDRFKRCTACAAPAFDRDMLGRAEAQVNKMLGRRQISHAIADTMHRIFKEDYGAAQVLSLPDYSSQCTVVNSRIWKRLFSEPAAAPELIYLEIEKIAAMLLSADMVNHGSLARCVMFDPMLRHAVLERLDGAVGCWSLEKLYRHMETNVPDDREKKHSAGWGTVFFWGLDDAGKKIPLCPEPDGSHTQMLHGKDDHGRYFGLPYTPESIADFLHKKKIIPSLFTCFLTLSFARGIACIGGYFQGEYLPHMQHGLADSLEKNGYSNAVQSVLQVPADFYLSGVLAVMAASGDHCLIPAGPAEIIAGRGISPEDIGQMHSLTVRDAHIAGLSETVPDAAAQELLGPGWKKNLAADCFRVLTGKIPVKQMLSDTE